MSVAPMMVFHVPEDPAWLQAFGRVAIVHAQLDHILRMTIKTLAGITIEVAMDATEREPSSLLRERIRKLAKARLGEGAALLQLQALIERCKRATGQRNEWVHNIVGREWNGGDAAMWKAGRKWAPLATVQQLDQLTEEMQQVIGEINFARLHGWLAEALAKSSPAKPAG